MANLTWKTVDEVAEQLGVSEHARAKWRQRGRGVPPVWQIRIVQQLMAAGTPVSLADFDRLEPTPGRIAA
jgi:hypothetical protein